MWDCKICDREFPDEIPSDAVLTNSQAGIYVYQFAEGVTHVLYRKRLNLKATHNREHKTWKEKTCEYCFPPPPKPEPPAPPVVAVDPTPTPVIELPQVEKVVADDDSEIKPTTAIALAFRRLSTKS